MFSDFRERPSAWSVIGLALIGLPLSAVSTWMQRNRPDDELAILLIGLVGSICILAAFGLLIWLIVSVLLGFLEHYNEIRSTTARLKEMQQAERLSPEQLAILPRLEYGANVAIHLDPKKQRERRFFLMTPGGMVPWEFCQQYLLDCGVTSLKPIGHYSEGTQGYDHARWFTNWLRDNGFAVGGDGSRAGQSAQWLTEQSKAEACMIFDVDLNLNSPELRRHYTEGNNEN